MPKLAATAPSVWRHDQERVRGHNPGRRGHRANADGVPGMRGRLGASHSGEEHDGHHWDVNRGGRLGRQLERTVMMMMGEDDGNDVF